MERQIEHRLTEVEERSKSNTKRIDELKKQQDNINELVSSVKVVAEREVRLESDVQEIKADVKDLKAIPAKRWEAVVGLIISAVVGAAIGLILAKIGL